MLHAGVVRYRISPVADIGLYEFVVSGGGETGWFLLDPDEAHALCGLFEDLDPDLEAFEFADLCGLVRAVTGTPPPTEELRWPPLPA